MAEVAPECISKHGHLYIRDDVVSHLQPREPVIEHWLSVSELSRLSGFTKSSLYRAMREGRLAYKCPNGTKYGRRVSLTEWRRFVDAS